MPVETAVNEKVTCSRNHILKVSWRTSFDIEGNPVRSGWTGEVPITLTGDEWLCPICLSVFLRDVGKVKWDPSPRT